MLREATADIVKSWKFKLPNLFRTEWKYDTIFKYHLSGKGLESNETAKLTIVVAAHPGLSPPSHHFLTRL